jgi:radical SAM superfamily enzyme YgiQ (UPF0313 family)
VEISRGCPFDCSYCINSHLKKIYGVRAKHHRQMSVDNAIERLEYIKETYKPEFLRFVDESFTIVNTQYLRELSEKYRKKINIPFWIQTSAVTLNEEKARLLKEMNCAAVSIGAEHGDEHFRKTVLKKKVTDKQLYKAMEFLKKYNIRRSAYFMVGLPFENRSLAFKSIKMYKEFLNTYGAAPSGIQCFFPFPATGLYNVCLENNFISSNADPEKALYWPALDMPNFTYNEIIGIKRTFFAYSVMDEKLYPLIEACEEPNQLADKMLNIISIIYAK